MVLEGTAKVTCDEHVLTVEHNRSTYIPVGARHRLVTAGSAAFPFLDLASGERWTVRPNRGPLPWWLLSPSRRVPGTRARDYLGALKLAFAGRDATVEAVLGRPRELIFCWSLARKAIVHVW